MATQTDGPIPPPPGLSDCEPDEKKQGFTCVRAPQLKAYPVTSDHEGYFPRYLVDQSFLQHFLQAMTFLLMSAYDTMCSMTPGSRAPVNLGPWFELMEAWLKKMRKLPTVCGYGANQGLRFVHMV